MGELNSFPIEILFLIFAYLDNVAWCRLHVVCKRWNSVTSDVILNQRKSASGIWRLPRSDTDVYEPPYSSYQQKIILVTHIGHAEETNGSINPSLFNTGIKLATKMGINIKDITSRKGINCLYYLAQQRFKCLILDLSSKDICVCVLCKHAVSLGLSQNQARPFPKTIIILTKGSLSRLWFSNENISKYISLAVVGSFGDFQGILDNTPKMYQSYASFEMELENLEWLIATERLDPQYENTPGYLAFDTMTLKSYFIPNPKTFQPLTLFPRSSEEFPAHLYRFPELTSDDFEGEVPP